MYTDDLLSFRGSRVLVLGDLVLDHYLEGRVDRISPEAPVPVVTLDGGGERFAPGGAANVALNVLSLGGSPIVAGTVGDDPDGGTLTDLLSRRGVDVSCITVDRSRPTTRKTRVISRGYQLIRIDRESTLPCRREKGSPESAALLSALRGAGAVIFEDYDKGFLGDFNIPWIIGESRQRGIPVLADPKFRNFALYRGVSLIKPNLREASAMLGRDLDDATTEELKEACGSIISALDAQAVLLTLGAGGSILSLKDGADPLVQSTAARHVFDVSGAGDAVIAVMGLAYASGVPPVRAAVMANYAAAAVCAEPGVYAVTPGDILREARLHE